MKKLFSLVLVAGLALASLVAVPEAEAQGYRGFSESTLFDGGTNKVLGNVTNDYAHTKRIDVPKATEVAITVTYVYSAASSGGLRLDLKPGTGSTTGASNTVTSLVFPGNGTTPVSYTTNISVGAIPYFYAVLANTNASIFATNLTITYGFKN
jgi:hypothetical protein